MKLLFLALFCLMVVHAGAEKQPYERYVSIIDRQMFGTPPAGFDPMKMPSEVSKSSQKELTKEQEKLQSAIHFSVINVAADGTAVVGFSDNSDPKMPVHHYLKVGEESGGWKVVSADLASSSMTIVKDGVELTLKLGDNSGKSGKNGAGAPAAVPAVASAHGEGTRRSGLLGSLRSRRFQREKIREEQIAAEKKAQEEERARREQEREEQRMQLAAIQEELARQREEKAKAAENKEKRDENNNPE